MERRTFLQTATIGLLLVGCGGGTSNTNITPTSSGGGSGTTAPSSTMTVDTRSVVLPTSSATFRATPDQHTVSRVNADGTTAWTVGSRGQGNGQFDHPLALALDGSGRLLVVDHGNHRVQVFDATTGAYMSHFGSLGTGNGQFRLARAITVRNALIHVSDQFNHRVQAFSLDGVFMFSVGTFGSGTSQLNGTAGVAVDSAGRILVADQGNRAIKIFLKDGTFVGRFDGGVVGNPKGLFLDEDDQLYVADGLARRILVFGADGTLRENLPAVLSDGTRVVPFDVHVQNGLLQVYGQADAPSTHTLTQNTRTGGSQA